MLKCQSSQVNQCHNLLDIGQFQTYTKLFVKPLYYFFSKNWSLWQWDFLKKIKNGGGIPGVRVFNTYFQGSLSSTLAKDFNNDLLQQWEIAHNVRLLINLALSDFYQFPFGTFRFGPPFDGTNCHLKAKFQIKRQNRPSKQRYSSRALSGTLQISFFISPSKIFTLSRTQKETRCKY